MLKLKLIHYLLPVGIFLWCWQPAKSQRLPDQVVTWADFSNVVYLASSMNYVYAATTGGIIKYDKIARKFETPLTGGVGLPDEPIQRLWIDTFDKLLIIATESGRYEYDGFFKRWAPVLEPVELATDTRHINTPTNMFPPFGFNFLSGGALIDPSGRDFPVSDLIDDGSGTLWLGTWGHGLATAESSSKLIELLPFGLIQNGVAAIFQDDSLLWLGGPVGLSYRTGLTAFNPHDNSFTYVESGLDRRFPVSDVYCLTGDSLAVFIGCSEGLLVYDKAIGAITDQLNQRRGLPEDEVTALQLKNDSLFVGTTGGICVLDFASDTITYVYPGEFQTQLIYDFELVDSTLWIAAENGAYRLILTDNSLHRFQDPKMVVFSRALAIERDGDFLWLAGDDGLVRLDTKTGATIDFQGGELRSVKRTTPFRPLAVSDQIAATSTDNGLALVFLQTDKPIYREFTTQEGLPSGNVLSLKLDGDYLWVGTDSGLTSFWWNNPNRVD